MEQLILLALGLLLSYGDQAQDPAARVWFGRQEGRQLECERLDQADAHRARPLDVPPAPSRMTALADVDALLCRRRMLRADVRPAQDELILGSLGRETGAVVRQAAATTPSAARWFIDAHYPQPQVASKIANAARTSLAELGRTVSMHAPLLAAGDLEVLHSMQLEDALPVACRRLWDAGSLKPGDALLAVGIVRARESVLHAGVCEQGSWRWLQ